MSRSALVLRHIHVEDLGTLAPLLEERGYTMRYVDPAVDDMAGLDALAPELLVVLGGPIGAFDDALYPFLPAELALVAQRLASGRPLLGICLGAQRLAGTAIGANQAFALGAQVLGLQFHLEADTQQIERWLVGHASELAQAGIDPRALREQARRYQAPLAAAAAGVFRAWLDGLNPGTRQTA